MNEPAAARAWRIDPVAYDDPDAERLRAAQRRELDARYGSSDHEPGTAPTAADVAVFLIARDSTGEALACGGVRDVDSRHLGPNVVEIKRMYVAPASRGTGVAAAILTELTAIARSMHAAQLVLETGTLQPDAVRFYEKHGFRRIPLYGAYIGSELSLCYGLSLH